MRMITRIVSRQTMIGSAMVVNVGFVVSGMIVLVL